MNATGISNLKAAEACRDVAVRACVQARARVRELVKTLRRVGCQDEESCGETQPDGLCFVCAAIARAEDPS